MGRGRSTVSVGAGTLLCAGLACAQPTVVQWAGPISGMWSDPGKWSPQQVPNNAGPNTFDARITATGGAYTVTLDTPNTVTDFLLDTADGTLMGAQGGSLTVEGTATLRRATLVGVDLFRTSGTLLLETSAGDIIICDVCIDHGGTALWSGSAGDLLFDNGGEFLNGSGAVFEIANDRTARWTGQGAMSRFVNDGTLLKSAGTGVTFFDGLEFENNGTIHVASGTLRINGLTITANKLTRGVYRIDDAASLDLPGTTLLENTATVQMTGQGSSFAALDTLRLNDAGGALAFDDRDFTTTGNFENLGTLSLLGGSEFAVVPGSRLKNYRAVPKSLKGGVFEIAGTLRFDGADIRTVLADVTLDGPGADIVETSGASGTALLERVGKTGRLALRSGRDFTTAGDFEVQGKGVLDVGAGTTFTTTGALLNAPGSTFQGGVFHVGGTLRFPTAGIATIDNTLTLDGPSSQVLDQNGNDALAPLSTVGPSGHLSLINGRVLTVDSSLTVFGRVTIGPDGQDQPSRLIVQGSYIQENRRTVLDNGVIEVGISGQGQYVQNQGVVEGQGQITGSMATAARVDPQGFGVIKVSEDLLVQPGFVLDIAIGLPAPGPGPAMTDVLDVGGLLSTSGVPTGVLRVSVVNYAPMPGEVFDVVFYGGLDGAFEKVIGQAPGGLRFLPLYQPDRLQLVVVPAPGGALTLGVLCALGVVRRR